MWMNRYEFLDELSKRYPAYISDISDSYFVPAETIKNICEDIGFKGSYLKFHHYDLDTDYNYGVILDYIEKNEEVKTMLLFHEL